jgi:hypothetical protein
VALVLLACGAPDSVGHHAEACGSCHIAEAEAFAGSAHAVAATSPTYLAEADASCDVCHAPTVGTRSGLSCVTCHAARGTLGLRDGLLVHDLAGPVRGGAGAAAPHSVHPGGFVGSDDLCRTCHAPSEARQFAAPPSHPPEGPGENRCTSCHLAGHRFPRTPP